MHEPEYEPEFHGAIYRIPPTFAFTRSHGLKIDNRRVVWFTKSTGKIKTLLYPRIHPLARRARDME